MKADQLLHLLDTGILVIKGSPLKVECLNAQARRWLEDHYQQKVQDHHRVDQLFPQIRFDRLFKRLKKGQKASFVFDFESQHDIKSQIPIQFILKDLGQESFLLEGHDYSSTRETEMMLNSYSSMIEQKNKSLEREKKRVERLLLNILPQKSVHQLKRFGQTTPERFQDVSVMFLDFVGFTQLSQQMSVETLFSELNEIFTEFDTIIAQHRCERIKTIGDAYLAVCGMPERVEDHAQLISCAAYKMRHYIIERNQRSKYTWTCRIGIHTGEVTGGVVGRLKYIYDIFGDGVNTASRMESYSQPMKINLSSSIRQHLGPNYKIEDRGLIDVKGKGMMNMFFLEEIYHQPCESRLLQLPQILDPQDSIDIEPSQFANVLK